MKKRTLLLVLLLATAVLAGENLVTEYDKGIVRLADFETDNVHILRLQEAAGALGGNVSELKREMASFQLQRSGEIAQLQASIDTMQRSWLAQMAALQISIDKLGSKFDKMDKITAAQVAVPEVQEPAEVEFPPYMVLLMAVNIILLFIVIILIFWLRGQYYVHKESKKDIPIEEHIHPAPPELIAYVKGQFEKDKKLHDIRMELANKGWTPSIIEHAIHAAKER